jgi:hypothetical protein
MNLLTTKKGDLVMGFKVDNDAVGSNAKTEIRMDKNRG